jgi:hypothetical protein
MRLCGGLNDEAVYVDKDTAVPAMNDVNPLTACLSVLKFGCRL